MLAIARGLTRQAIVFARRFDVEIYVFPWCESLGGVYETTVRFGDLSEHEKRHHGRCQ